MLEVEKTRRVFWTNRVSFAFSLLICFGLSLVANFQVFAESIYFYQLFLVK